MKFLLVYLPIYVKALFNSANRAESEIVDKFVNSFEGELSEKVKIVKGRGGFFVGFPISRK